MNTTRFDEAIDQYELTKYESFLRAQLRPTIDILTHPDRQVVGKSKFNGSPDLPPGMSWPQHADRPYRFLFQLNFAELPKVGVAMPSTGLISFFINYDPTGNDECSEWEDDFASIYYFPTETKLTSTAGPHELRLGECKSLDFVPGVDVPCCGDGSDTWTAIEGLDVLYDFRCDLRGDVFWQHYLLGSPTHFTVCEDLSPGSDWLTLLNFGTDDDLVWCWADGDRISGFIEQASLAKGDFSHLKFIAG